ncbi:PIN domain-containing protein [Vulcanisaeta thermophila]|uniref:PIN domain-containing protein n=1 Tax=Vulcanisaeta thermophila TaxID=867917 RepID=UPI001EE1A39B|nr:PIN domain-containing protein [Vulcanisaeta thermophila]
MSNKIECVIFDTSALLMMFKDNIRLMDHVSSIVGVFIPMVTLPIVMELKKLSSGNREIARIALTALDYILRRFSIAKAQGSADDSVVQVAVNYKCIVVTCDQKLRRRLRRLGVRVIYYRESSGRFEPDFY